MSVVGVIVVVTVFDVLFPVEGSSCAHVIVAKFDKEPHVVFTVHVITTLHVHPLFIVPTFHVNIFHEKLPVDETNHVNHEGRVSEITTPVAVAGHAFA